MKKIFIYIVVVFVLFSCEKEVTVDLPRAEDKLVVEGVIEQGNNPYVILTKNASYFDPVDSNTITDMLVMDAKITVSDGTTTDSLILTFDPFQLPFFKYVGNNMIGEAGKTYSLKIETEGKTYTAKTTIPYPVKLDSCKFKEIADPEDSIGVVWIYFTDPDTLGNYYRGYTKVLGKDNVFTHPSSSVYDDRLVNGQRIEFTLTKGWDPAQGDDVFDDDDTFPWWSFIRGDNVVVKLSSMDAESYTVLYSIEVQMATDGNPFASPTTAKTNISGNALGFWCGYGIDMDTIIFNDNYIID